MADIDSFKRINDTHGHLVGDEVIRQVARQLQEHARPGDLVSRYGGEEFCVILCDLDENGGEDWANEVCKRISELQIRVHEVQIQVAASFGVAARTEDTCTPEQLVDRADQSMLVAKRSGRGSVVSFGSINESARLRAIAAGGPGGLFRGLLARHVMRIMVASLNQEETIGQAADFFLRFRISAAPVVDDDGRLVGYLSERDVIKIMLWPNCWSSKIKEVMQTGVVCYDEDTPVLTIYDFLCRVSLRNVLILKDGRPTGILSRGSLLRWFYNSVVTPEEGTPGTGLHQSDTMSKGRAVDTARQLVNEAQEVVAGLKMAPDELVSCLVGGVSRMQELLNDLLAWSRFVNTTTNRAFTGWLADEGMPEREKTTENPHVRPGMAGLVEGGPFPHSDALSDA
jgi:diguanylate cyclase (GGDEF)-like protein